MVITTTEHKPRGYIVNGWKKRPKNKTDEKWLEANKAQEILQCKSSHFRRHVFVNSWLLDTKWLVLHKEAPTYQSLKRVPPPVLDVLKPICMQI